MSPTLPSLSHWAVRGWWHPPTPILPPLPQVVSSPLMAAVVSHYDPIWRWSWSHQRAVSTQTTAALLQSAAVETGRDLLQVRMTPPSSPPPSSHPPGCGCRLACQRASAEFVTHSGSDWARGQSFAELMTASRRLPLLRRRAAIWTRAASAREGEGKTTLSFWCLSSSPPCFTPHSFPLHFYSLLIQLLPLEDRSGTAFFKKLVLWFWLWVWIKFFSTTAFTWSTWVKIQMSEIESEYW